MNVHALLLADSAQAVDGKLYILGGAWSMVTAATFPTQHPLGIAVAIDVGWNETNQSNHVELFVEDADGKRFENPRIEADFEAGRPPGLPAGSEQRVVFAFNGAIEIPSAGSYALVLKLGGSELARTRFTAVARAK